MPTKPPPPMSRGHFQALAQCVRYALDAHGADPIARAAIVCLARRIAQVCADSNPRFAPARFMDACGPECEA